MKDLQVGDKVLTVSNDFQPVYSFGQHDDSIKAMFFQIFTSSTDSRKKNHRPLEMTGDHLIVSHNGKTMRADELNVGDLVMHGGVASNHSSVKVTKITKTTKTGLYMPLTPDGTIVVDGLVASNYVSIQDNAPGTFQAMDYLPFMTQERMLHWWLSPFRMLCMGVSSSFCSNDANTNEEGILNWLVLGENMAKFADGFSVWFQLIVMGLPLVVVFGFFNLAEWLLMGPRFAPTIMFVLMFAGPVLYSKFSWIQAGKPKKE